MGKKTLCKLAKKDVQKEDFEYYSSLVDKPRYICKDCGRAVNKKDRVCEPKKI